MPRDLSVEIDARYVFYGVDVLHLQIDHAAAFLTDKMIMRKSFRVEMIHAVPHVQLLNLAEIRQKLKVPIDGAKAYIRKSLPDFHIDHICGRMVFSVCKAVLDHLPLPAVFQCHVIS